MRILTTSIPPFTVGEGILFQFQSDTPGTRWRLTGDEDLPDGVLLLSDGMLRGGAREPGAYRFTVRAAKSGASATEAFTLYIQRSAPPVPPPAGQPQPLPPGALVIAPNVSQVETWQAGQPQEHRVVNEGWDGLGGDRYIQVQFSEDGQTWKNSRYYVPQTFQRADGTPYKLNGLPNRVGFVSSLDYTFTPGVELYLFRIVDWSAANPRPSADALRTDIWL